MAQGSRRRCSPQATKSNPARPSLSFASSLTTSFPLSPLPPLRRLLRLSPLLTEKFPRLCRSRPVPLLFLPHLHLFPIALTTCRRSSLRPLLLPSTKAPTRLARPLRLRLLQNLLNR